MIPSLSKVDGFQKKFPERLINVGIASKTW